MDAALPTTSPIVDTDTSELKLPKSLETRISIIEAKKEKGTVLKVTEKNIAQLNQTLEALIKGKEKYGDVSISLADLNIKICFDLDIELVKKHCTSTEFKELSEKLGIKTVQHIREVQRDEGIKKIKEELLFLATSRGELAENIKTLNSLANFKKPLKVYLPNNLEEQNLAKSIALKLEAIQKKFPANHLIIRSLETLDLAHPFRSFFVRKNRIFSLTAISEKEISKTLLNRNNKSIMTLKENAFTLETAQKLLTKLVNRRQKNNPKNQERILIKLNDSGNENRVLNSSGSRIFNNIFTLHRKIATLNQGLVDLVSYKH